MIEIIGDDIKGNFSSYITNIATIPSKFLPKNQRSFPVRILPGNVFMAGNIGTNGTLCVVFNSEYYGEKLLQFSSTYIAG